MRSAALKYKKTIKIRGAQYSAHALSSPNRLLLSSVGHLVGFWSSSLMSTVNRANIVSEKEEIDVDGGDSWV